MEKSKNKSFIYSTLNLKHVKNKIVMKIKRHILIIVFIFLMISKISAQVGIGTTLPYGALDITSATDGLLIPRVALTATTTVLPVLTGTTRRSIRLANNWKFRNCRWNKLSRN